MAGIVLSVLLIRRSRYGVDLRLLGDHSRWLVAGESVVIVPGAPGNTGDPDSPAAGKRRDPPRALHPPPGRRQPGPGGLELRVAAHPVATSGTCQAAGDIHQLAAGPPRDVRLLERVERDRRWIHRTCVVLTEASRLEEGVPPSAEWLLDNEYILESNARGIRRNLPGGTTGNFRYSQTSPTVTCRASTTWPGSSSPTRTCVWTRRTSLVLRCLSRRRDIVHRRALGRSPDAASRARGRHPAHCRQSPD